MIVLFTIWLGCGSAPTSEEPAAPEVPEAAAPAEVVAPLPAGRIGGQPILPKPVVIGGIANADVEAGVMARKDQIVACFETQRAQDPTLSGKVLIKFSIDAEGKVSRAATRSTSLRNDVVENCVNAEVVKAVFPKLQSGRFAIVQYPFVFPFP